MANPLGLIPHARSVQPSQNWLQFHPNPSLNVDYQVIVIIGILGLILKCIRVDESIADITDFCGKLFIVMACCFFGAHKLFDHIILNAGKPKALSQDADKKNV